MNQREDLTVLGRFTKILYRKKVKRGGEKGRSFGDQGQFGVDPLPSVPGGDPAPTGDADGAVGA